MPDAGGQPTAALYVFQLGDGRELSLRGLAHSESQGSGHFVKAGHATGAAQWPAGVLLCDYLRTALGGAALAGRRVAELGCGLGMCGLVAAALAGPTGSVLLTDGAQLLGCVLRVVRAHAR
jgi:hypothetical protein